MKQSTNSPQSDKRNGTLSRDDESGISKIQEHLQDKNHVSSDEDIMNIPVKSGSVDDKETVENNRLVSKIMEEDPDEEYKVGLESPWNIYS